MVNNSLANDADESSSLPENRAPAIPRAGGGLIAAHMSDNSTSDAIASGTLLRGIGQIVRRQFARLIEWGSRHPILGCLGCLGFLAILGVMILTAGIFLFVLFSGEEESDTILELPVNEARTSLNEIDPAVEEYVAGIVAFDAEKMLQAYDEEIRVAMTSQGQSAVEFQSRLDQAKAAGGRILSARQVASYRLNNGARYVFYVLTREGFPPGGGLEEIYFIFTVSPSGKILRVV